MGYRITAESIGGTTALFLAKEGRKSFLSELADSPKTTERAALIARTITRVGRSGTSWAVASKVLKSLDGKLSVFELRVKGRVIRVMTYVHGDVPVYLFDFDGHQGKSGTIPSDTMNRARRLAAEARRLMEEMQ